MSTNRTEIHDGFVVKVTFGWADRRRHDPSDTYRFQFFEVGSSLATTIGPDRKSIAQFDVPTSELKFFLSDLEDAAKKLRQHMAQDSN
jgi:hypothetical protein